MRLSSATTLFPVLPVLLAALLLWLPAGAAQGQLPDEAIMTGSEPAGSAAAEPDADGAAGDESATDESDAASESESEAELETDSGVDSGAWDKWDDEHSIKRATERSIAWPKALLVQIAFLIWVRTGDWINRDVQIYRLNHLVWNPVVLVSGVLAGALLFVAPFVVSGPLIVLTPFALIIAYAIAHNRAVEPHQKVFTRDWLRHTMAGAGGAVGMKVSTEKQADYMKGAAVELIARGSDDPTKNKANLLTARQSPGYVLVKELVADMVRSRCDQVMFDYRQDTVATRRNIDGVWHNGEAVERDTGDVMLAVMKQLANLKPTERQRRQSGQIGAEYEGGQYSLQITSQGVKTGERVMLAVRDIAAKSLRTYAELGMRDKIRTQWEEVMAADTGFAVISAPAGGGLTTLFDVSLLETDRLMRDFFAIEDVHHPERDIENVAVKPYDSKQGETPATHLEKLIRLYPNVYVCRDLVDAKSAKGLMDEVRDEKLLVTGVNAKEAPEALLRLLEKDVPHRDLAETVTAVINTRLIRKLCDACKVGHEPPPALLQKLGIPAGKVELLYAPPKPEDEKRPCEVCGGIGYLGRTGLFELLIVNDKVREVLLKQPKIEYLRKAARGAGMRNHQEEGILLVAKGTTSLQELQRVLKG
ncbi:MAG: ATPase, T2SS/T4P/T4SS family [Planctomycetota bacterium]